MEPNKPHPEDEAFLDLEGPVRLRRNKSQNALSQQSQSSQANPASQALPTSGSLIMDGGAGKGPVSRAQSHSGSVRSTAGGFGPPNTPKGAFKPNVQKALATASKKSGTEFLKIQSSRSDLFQSGDSAMGEDLGDLLTSSIHRASNMHTLRQTPGSMHVGGAMDAANIRGAQGPRRQGPSAEMNVRAFHEHTRLMERRRQQLNASKDEKGGISLTDLAFIEDGAPYPPVVVPYLMTEANEDEADETMEGTRGSRGKYTTKFIDETSRKAGHQLFSSLIGEGAFDDGSVEWFLMQFPWRLPEGPGGAKGLSDLPSGRIGELVVRESGRVELVLEKHIDQTEKAIKLDVNVGAESAFHQQVVSYDTKNNEMVVLGDVTKRMVLTPQLVDEA